MARLTEKQLREKYPDWFKHEKVQESQPTDIVTQVIKNRKLVEVGAGDPGKQKDSFAYVQTEVDLTRKRIGFVGAHGWDKVNYPKVEKDLATIHTAKKLDFMIMESNNTGIHVIDSLKYIHKVPVIGIYTSKNIKSEEIIRKGMTMDKNDMVTWINSKRQKKQLVFPGQLSPGLKKLKNQFDSFVKKVTPGGTTTYQAEGEEHDDFVMAAMINLFFVRTRLFKEGGKGHVAVPFSYGNKVEVDQIGTALKPHQYLLSSSVYQPK